MLNIERKDYPQWDGQILRRYSKVIRVTHSLSYNWEGWASCPQQSQISSFDHPIEKKSSQQTSPSKSQRRALTRAVHIITQYNLPSLHYVLPFYHIFFIFSLYLHTCHANFNVCFQHVNVVFKMVHKCRWLISHGGLDLGLPMKEQIFKRI